MSQKIYLNDGYRVVFQTPDDDYSYFFGYYDKSPLNIENTKLLAHRVNFDGRDVQNRDIAEIGYFDLKNGNFVKLDETLAWNWQQGSQLQWLPPVFDQKIIYNSILENNFVSIILDIHTLEKQIISYPVYAVHPNGREALGVNYERLYWCRPGYNYKNIKKPKWNKPYHKDDGIFKIDLVTGEHQKVVNIIDIVNYNKLPEFENCNNWLEHMMYNPDGSRFMFFHRWNDNGIDHSRVFTASSKNGKNLFMYPDVRFYSHYSWLDNEKLSIWSKEPSQADEKTSNNFNRLRKNIFLKTVLKPFYLLIKNLLPEKFINKIQNNSKILLYSDQTNHYKILGEGTIHGNGHQTWFNDKVHMLIDTYQDSENYRHLLIFDTLNNTFEFIGKFYSLYNDSVFRCDLHPRLNKDNSLVVIDTAHTEKRKLLVIKTGTEK